MGVGVYDAAGTVMNDSGIESLVLERTASTKGDDASFAMVQSQHRGFISHMSYVFGWGRSDDGDAVRNDEVWNSTQDGMWRLTGWCLITAIKVFPAKIEAKWLQERIEIMGVQMITGSRG